VQETPTTTQEPLVSVIIPAYNVAPFIREGLQSVFAQTYRTFEVIVVNDGSPDSQLLEAEIESYRDSITYVKQENQGAGAARNAGLKVARGEFVAFLDGDDVWLPEFLTEQLRLIESGFDLVYADAINFGERDYGPLTNMSVNPSNGEVTFEKLLCGECNVITSSVVARLAPIKQLGGFDTRFPNSQDFDLWLRLAKDAKAKIGYQRVVLVKRRIYAGSLASDVLKSFAGELKVLDKVLGRDDLTPQERKTIEDVIPMRRATADVIRGKRALANGEYDAAREAFSSAQRYLQSWKLRFVLAGVRTFPHLLRYWLRARPT
jgi:glycosyltransferase involved in cell wall biosynthesis